MSDEEYDDSVVKNIQSTSVDKKKKNNKKSANNTTEDSSDADSDFMKKINGSKKKTQPKNVIDYISGASDSKVDIEESEEDLDSNEENNKNSEILEVKKKHNIINSPFICDVEYIHYMIQHFKLWTTFLDNHINTINRSPSSKELIRNITFNENKKEILKFDKKFKTLKSVLEIEEAAPKRAKKQTANLSTDFMNMIREKGKKKTFRN